MAPAAALMAHFLLNRQYTPLDYSKASRDEVGKLTNGFIHAQNQTTRFHRRLNRIHLHERRLPHKRVQIIPHAFIVKVDARPDIPLAVFHPQLRQNISRVEARIVAELPGDDLERFGKRFHNRLLLPRDIGIRVLV